jgi:transcriptional regulator with XRE-family HTH domain
MTHSPTEIQEIAKRLIDTRGALGYSQAELFKSAGIRTNTYNQWEMAKGRPQLDEALKLCTRLGYTLDWIYRGDPSGLPYRITSKLPSRNG